MKLKVSEWGNSHGLRISSSIMDHLKIHAGDEVEVNLTNNGIEITKSGYSLDFLDSVKRELLDSMLTQTNPVDLVEDPYLESAVAYIVIDVEPYNPIIREVPKGTMGSFSTLVDAKEAARQKIQSTISQAQKSLAELRQIGINEIAYIAL